MITSFEVGSVFAIVDKASPVISELSKEMKDFGKLVADTKKLLQDLGTSSFAGLNKNLKAATDRVAQLEAAARSVVVTTDAATASALTLTTQWRAAAAAAAQVSRAARTSVPSIRYGGGGSGVPAVGGSGGTPRKPRNPRNVLPKGGSGGWFGNSVYGHGPSIPIGGAGFGV